MPHKQTDFPAEKEKEAHSPKNFCTIFLKTSGCFTKDIEMF